MNDYMENSILLPSQQSIVYDEVGFTPDDSQSINNYQHSINNVNDDDTNDALNNAYCTKSLSIAMPEDPPEKRVTDTLKNSTNAGNSSNITSNYRNIPKHHVTRRLQK